MSARRSPTAITPSAYGRITIEQPAASAGPTLRVIIAELSGSESVVHFDLDGRTWVSQSHGIHPFEVGATARLFVDMDQSFFFDPEGRFVAGGGYG